MFPDICTLFSWTVTFGANRDYGICKIILTPQCHINSALSMTPHVTPRCHLNSAVSMTPHVTQKCHINSAVSMTPHVTQQCHINSAVSMTQHVTPRCHINSAVSMTPHVTQQCQLLLRAWLSDVIDTSEAEWMFMKIKKLIVVKISSIFWISAYKSHIF